MSRLGRRSIPPVMASTHTGYPVLHRKQFVADTTALVHGYDSFTFVRKQSDRVNTAPVALGQPVINTLFQPVSRPTMVGFTLNPWQAPSSTQNEQQRLWQFVAPARGSIETGRQKPIMTQRPFMSWVFAVPSPSRIPDLRPVGR